MFTGDVVGEPGLLEEDRDLVAVGRGPIIDVEHSRISLALRSLKCRR
jgi:hypothetical protein